MIESALHKFKPISLSQMDEVALMKRMDTKFILNLDQLHQTLQHLTAAYSILEIKENRIMTYASDYYDTASHKFYLDHHNKMARRTKVRIRNYVESKLFFLEVKQKDVKGNTVKSRIPVKGMQEKLSEEAQNFVNKSLSPKLDLHKTLSNGFNRVTLVNRILKERVTIDLNLSYNSKIFNPNLAIVELKQEKFNRHSPLVLELRKQAIFPYSISKYCMGMASLQPTLKQNHFKQKFLRINKLTA